MQSDDQVSGLDYISEDMKEIKIASLLKKHTIGKAARRFTKSYIPYLFAQ